MERVELISIDPGKNHFAYAKWARNKLLSCGRSAVTTEVFRGLQFGSMDCVVIEVPQIYSQRKWKGDPNDLVDVAVTVGRLAQASGDGRFELVRPRAWKGTVEKEVHQMRIRKELSPSERALLGPLTKKDARDVLDAIGIGLWKLGRL